MSKKYHPNLKRNADKLNHQPIRARTALIRTRYATL